MSSLFDSFLFHLVDCSLRSLCEARVSWRLMSTTTSAAKCDEVTLFQMAIDAISNDKFLAFIEQYTNALIAPTSARFLPWCSKAVADYGDDDAGASLLQGDGSCFQAFSVKHHNAFSAYRAMFESRLVSILKTLDADLTPEHFFDICCSVMSRSMCISKETSDVSSSSQHDDDVSAERLCEVMLDMVNAVSSFQSFAGMLAARQSELLAELDEPAVSDNESTSNDSDQV